MARNEPIQLKCISQLDLITNHVEVFLKTSSDEENTNIFRDFQKPKSKKMMRGSQQKMTEWRSSVKMNDNKVDARRRRFNIRSESMEIAYGVCQCQNY